MEPGPSSPDQNNRSPIGPLQLKGLTTADYLKAEPKLTAEQKSALAVHLSRGFTAGSGPEAADTEAILRLMVWNAEPSVVEAMARAAAQNPDVPRSLAWALANDDEAAAVHVLAASAALADADLVSIIQSSGNFAKLNSIARRPSVSTEVSRSLVEHGDETTAQTLLANAKAEIPEDAYGSVLDRFGASERIQKAISDRPAISPTITQRLAESASPKLPGFVEERSEEAWGQRLSEMMADSLLNEATLVRALLEGNFDFFARALAVLTGSPLAELRTRLLESPSAGLRAVWSNAPLPKDWLPVAWAALTALIHVDRTAGPSDRQLFKRNAVARTLANLKTEKVVLTDAQHRFFARVGSK